MKLNRLAPFVLTLLVLLTVRCAELPTEIRQPDTQLEISGTAPHFFWLPPIVSSTPSNTGSFDAEQAAVVAISRCSGRDCSSLTPIATSGAELPAVTVVPAKGRKDPYFTVQWRTRTFSLDLSSTYRVTVTVEGSELGLADVWLVGHRRDLPTVNSDDFVALVNGTNLDINFRIEQTAPPPPPPGEPPVVAIIAPVDGAQFRDGESILFEGSATDSGGQALSGDGLVWTSSQDGQLGTGTSFTRSDLTVGDHTIILTATDVEGRSGTASVTVEVVVVPPPPNEPPAASITSPADGAEFVVGSSISFEGSAIDPEDGELSGSALVWTSSRDGQIGTGTSFARSDLSEGTHTVTLTATDGQGATGAASVTIHVIMAPPPPPPPPPPPVQPIDPGTISAGRAHSCGLSASGLAYCWGENSFGQLGTGGWGGSALTPVAVQGVDSNSAPLVFTRISAGNAHTCGLAWDGRAYCWGYGSGGRLGIGNSGSRYYPTPVAGTLRFTSISVGHDHTCAVSTEDETYCWGANGNGRLGDGTTTSRSSPTRVAGSVRFRAVSAGTWHTCAISTANEAYCWGLNSSGNLGDGTTIDRHAPTAASFGLSFATISVGERHSCALTPQGDAFCWGGNNFGQVGDGSEFPRPNRLEPTAVIGGMRFSNLSAGYSHTCGVAGGGVAYCWGQGSGGQLGDGTTSASRSVPEPVAGAIPFAVIVGGYQHTCALTTDDRAYCWGSNGSGQLGDGTSEQQLTPTPVSGWSSLAGLRRNGSAHLAISESRRLARSAVVALASAVATRFSRDRVALSSRAG